jgi:hypothetical protein
MISIHFLESDRKGDDSEKYLIGIIILAILVTILFVCTVYFVYQIRQLKLSRIHTIVENSRDGDNSENIGDDRSVDNVNDYENVADEQSTYTALKMRKQGEDDAHIYCHLNKVKHVGKNQKESGI